MGKWIPTSCWTFSDGTRDLPGLPSPSTSTLPVPIDTKSDTTLPKCPLMITRVRPCRMGGILEGRCSVLRRNNRSANTESLVGFRLQLPAIILASALGSSCHAKAGQTQSSASAPSSPPVAAARDTSRPSDSLSTRILDPDADFEGSGDFIESTFRKELGESPRMGWVLPDTFLASERHPALFVWATGRRIHQARFARAVSPTEHQRIAKDAHLACDTKGPLAAYSLSDMDTLGERAFYTSNPPPPGSTAGVAFGPLTQQALSAAHQLISGTEPGVRFRDTAVVISHSPYIYTIDAVYDTSGAILRDALVLFDSLGTVVGANVKADTGETCDGCGAITFGDGYGRLYDVLNAFVIPGFPYPVLFLDTSTVEGRALSLATFDTKGRYGSYRTYEYVVTCILGDGQ